MNTKVRPAFVFLLAVTLLLCMGASIYRGAVGGPVGYGNFNTSQFSAPAGGVISITNGVLMTNAIFPGDSGSITFTNSAASANNKSFRIITGTDSLAVQSVNDSGLAQFIVSFTRSLVQVPVGIQGFFGTGITNAGWYHGTGALTNVGLARFEGGITNTSWYHGTGKLTNTAAVRLSGGVDGNIVINDAATGILLAGDTEPFIFGVANTGDIIWGTAGGQAGFANSNTNWLMQTTLFESRQAQSSIKTSFITATNQLSVGSYSYTVSTNLTTTGNTPTVMISIPVPTDKAVMINAKVIASQDSSANGGMYHVEAGGSNNGGTTAIISTQTILSEKESIAGTVAITFNNTTDAGELTITGVTATTIKWGALITVVISE